MPSSISSIGARLSSLDGIKEIEGLTEPVLAEILDQGPPFFRNQEAAEGACPGVVRLGTFRGVDLHDTVEVEKHRVPLQKDLEPERLLEVQEGGAVSEGIGLFLAGDAERRPHPLACLHVPNPCGAETRGLPERLLPLVGAGVVPAGYKGYLRLGDLSEGSCRALGPRHPRRVLGRPDDNKVVVHELSPVDEIALLPERRLSF